MKHAELKQLIREEIQKVLKENLTFIDLYKVAKDKYKNKVEGDEKAFSFSYPHGEIDMYPTRDGRVEITWWSGGDTEDTDYYSLEDAYKIITQNIK